MIFPVEAKVLKIPAPKIGWSRVEILFPSRRGGGWNWGILLFSKSSLSFSFSEWRLYENNLKACNMKWNEGGWKGCSQLFNKKFLGAVSSLQSFCKTFLFCLKLCIQLLILQNFRHYWTKLTPAISEGTFWPLWQEWGSKGAAPPCYRVEKQQKVRLS